MIDTHAHLNFDDYNDIDSVIRRAKGAGVVKIINIGSDLKSSQIAVQLAQKHGELYSTVGIHPDEATDNISIVAMVNELQRMIGPKVVAIGEAGLDYYRLENDDYKKIQHELFTCQIELAIKSSLPIIVHSREADEDMYKILKKYATKPNFKCVMHCFSGDEVFLEKIISLGIYVSFTGIITFPKTDKLEKAVFETPLDMLMIETDCPFLAPQLYRGKRNEPSYLVEVAKKIAEIKNITLSDVEKCTTTNATNFFNIA
ncbi:MAG: TatD family hydrolase [Patescibacteria group bacterium]